MPFQVQDRVAYRWSLNGQFIGEARVAEIRRDGCYRLEHLDGRAFPKGQDIFREEQLRPSAG
jgi:hypothetical protein